MLESAGLVTTRRDGRYKFHFLDTTPLGEGAKWLTVVSPEQPDGTELVLEPDEHPAAKPFKKALVSDGIPFTSFAVEEVEAEYERLRAAGVRFTQEPLQMGPVTPPSLTTPAAT